MKKTLVVLALFAAFGAQAQSNSDSTSSSTSSPNINSGNSGADSSSSSTSNPNNANQQFIQLNTLTPDTQTINGNSTSRSTSDSTSRIINEGTSTQNVRYSGTQTVKNVPGIAMSGPASGPCTGASGGLGVAGPGFGVGLNGSKVDDGCTVRENTRVLGQLFQALEATNPLKADAQAALIEGMTILRNMNAKIGDGYTQPKPVVASASPVMMPVTPVGGCAAYQGSDALVRARVCGN